MQQPLEMQQPLANQLAISCECEMQQPLANQLAISCECCGAILPPSGGARAVACSSCGEFSPVAPAPFGKQFVRCGFCSKLLLTQEGKKAVVCVRNTCGKTIILAPPSPGKQRGWCPNPVCNNFIKFAVRREQGRGGGRITFITCPACREVALVRPGRVKRNAVCQILVGFIISMGGAILAYLDHSQNKEGHGYVAWLGLLAGGLIWLIAGLVYLRKLNIPQLVEEHEGTMSGTYAPPPVQQPYAIPLAPQKIQQPFVPDKM